jgi:CubicO group peptidase (beta-lactamase class C family)
MKLLLRAAGIAAIVTSAAIVAQTPTAPGAAATRPVPAGPVGTRPTDAPRYLAAASASERAVAICSGLWSGNQTMELLEKTILFPTSSTKTEIDQAKRTVAVTYASDMPPRIAVWRNVLGCAQLPSGATMEDVRYLPQVSPGLRAPNFDEQPWPMGDRNATAELPAGQKAALDKVLEAAFDGTTYGGKTWGVVVVKDGRIVGERYGLGFDIHVGHQTHSAAKSFASTLAGIATKKNGLDIKRAPALQEWRRAGDPRGRITVENLLHMASGLYAEGGGSPQANIYYQGGTVAELAATNILHTLPGSRFLYNPPDTMLAVRAIRQAVGNDQRFLSYPFQELFWKIGMTRTITMSDWNGDFLMSGQTYSTARDFARFGLFYLADGVWNGERILPAGWAKYVATPAPAQPTENSARYGAQFWLYGGRDGLPADTFGPSGGLGQWSMIVPSKNMVVVRRGLDEANAFRMERFTADVIAAL